MGQTYGFLFTNYYPELLRKHKAQGDIAITDSEIATVEQWAKNLDSMTIKQYQTTDAKEQEKIENAFSNCKRLRVYTLHNSKKAVTAD